MEHRIIKLPKRLQTIADFIKRGSNVADIGTDHGKLPVYLAQTGISDRIIASDISAGSLMAAVRTAEKYDIKEKISFVNAPGLTGIDENDIDTIVIAGVGGETIIEILEETPWSKSGKTLILQPQTKKELLLSYLEQTGSAAVSDVKIVTDRDREYIIIFIDQDRGD